MSLVLEYGGGSPPPVTADILYAADTACISPHSSSIDDDSCPQFDAEPISSSSSSSSYPHDEGANSSLHHGYSSPVRISNVPVPMSESPPYVDPHHYRRRFSNPSSSVASENVEFGERRANLFDKLSASSLQPRRNSSALNNFNDALFSTSGDINLQHHSVAPLRQSDGFTLGQEDSSMIDRSYNSQVGNAPEHALKAIIPCSSHSTSYNSQVGNAPNHAPRAIVPSRSTSYNSEDGHAPPHPTVTNEEVFDRASSGARMAGKAIRRRKRSPPSVTRFDINDNSLHSVYTFIRSFLR